jgi:hydroxymethylglutaryl-CoA lyase
VQVDRFYDYMLDRGFTLDETVVHFHDTRGWGVANSLVALNKGYRYFDSSFGAVGGQPQTGAAMYHTGYAGNTCTEDLVGLFQEMGVDTGIDLELMVSAGKRAEEVLNRQLRSNYIHAGPVPHSGIEWNKDDGIVKARAAQ